MVLKILSNLIIGPLTMLFEIVFNVANKVFDSPLLILVAMSIVVNLFALPLYKRADAIQEEENRKQAEMKPWLDHIKKAFKGDERYMMTTTYYRQQNYNQLSVLKGSISLLLQIPFFIAAYQYLSNLSVLKTMSFWVFKNLGEPDRLFYIGNFAINILPIIMTVLNVVSAIIYLRGCTTSQKIQTYALAAFFLVFLYNSPSGLVIYWTCNQLFSLFKNIFLKLVKSKVVLGICVSAVGVAVFLAAIISGIVYSPKRILLFGVILLVCQIPLVVALIKQNKKLNNIEIKPLGIKPQLLSALFMTLFMGAVVPLTVIASSATEFVSYSNTPLEIILNNVSLMAGIFLVWESVFYFLGKTSVRNALTYITFALSGVAIFDFFVYGSGQGFISELLVYDTAPDWSVLTEIINLVVAILIAVALVILMKHFKKIMTYVCVVMIAGTVGLIITNATTTINDLNNAEEKTAISVEDATPEFELSKEGNNIVFIMLDRAASSYVPFALEERPELIEKFAGFTFYKNTICYGAVTHQAGPALFGGYDYTPYELNKRSNEKLNAKHTEAFQVIPSILSDNNYEITMANPIYIGSYYSPYDLDLFSKYKNTEAKNLTGKYLTKNTTEMNEYNAKLQNRNMFFYSLMKVIPICAQPTFYDGSEYFSNDTVTVTSSSFIEEYSELDALPNMSGITEEKKNTYFSILNSTSHQPAWLDPETYEPTVIDKYEAAKNVSQRTVNGVTMKRENPSQICHYNSFMAAIIQIGEWLDYLREQGVYDNTRIIIAADHGNYSQSFASLKLSNTLDINRYMPLLLVKDFNATEWTESNEYMTNADVPALILKDVVDNPVNPFTGHSISLSDSRKQGKHYIVETSNWVRADVEAGNQIIGNDQPWAINIPGDVFSSKNWLEIDFSEIDFSN